VSEKQWKGNVVMQDNGGVVFVKDDGTFLEFEGPEDAIAVGEALAEMGRRSLELRKGGRT
jgi:hypothetical protein